LKKEIELMEAQRAQWMQEREKEMERVNKIKVRYRMLAGENQELRAKLDKASEDLIYYRGLV
jgi:hypothetical protein